MKWRKFVERREKRQPVRERDTKTGRERERESERETQRERDRQTDRQTERYIIKCGNGRRNCLSTFIMDA